MALTMNSQKKKNSITEMMCGLAHVNRKKFLFNFDGINLLYKVMS